MTDKPHATKRALAGEASALGRLETVLAAARDSHYPPVERWKPDFCGEIDIRIARDGTWYYQGSPIARPALVKLFASVLRRDDDNRYYLVTPVEKLGIEVEDAPLIAVEMTTAGDGDERTIALRTNVDDHVVIGAEHPLWVITDPATGEPRPYVRLRGRIDALIARAVFYDLVEIALPQRPAGPLGVWSGGKFFVLGHA